MNELAPALSKSDARRLCDRIRRGVEDVVGLIVQLHDGHGWKALGYSTWKACCEAEFQRSSSWACRLVKDAEARRALPIGNEMSDGAVRELRRLPEDEREGALSDARERFGDNPTAAQVREIVDNYIADDEPYQPHDEATASVALDGDTVEVDDSSNTAITEEPELPRQREPDFTMELECLIARWRKAKPGLYTDSMFATLLRAKANQLEPEEEPGQE